MPEPDTRQPPDPPRLQLTLQRDPATHAWRADLHAESGLQHFDTLAALIAWLGRLDGPPPLRGIR